MLEGTIVLIVDIIINLIVSNYFKGESSKCQKMVIVLIAAIPL